MPGCGKSRAKQSGRSIPLRRRSWELRRRLPVIRRLRARIEMQNRELFWIGWRWRPPWQPWAVSRPATSRTESPIQAEAVGKQQPGGAASKANDVAASATDEEVPVNESADQDLADFADVEPDDRPEKGFEWLERTGVTDDELRHLADTPAQRLALPPQITDAGLRTWSTCRSSSSSIFRKPR